MQDIQEEIIKCIILQIYLWVMNYIIIFKRGGEGGCPRPTENTSLFITIETWITFFVVPISNN